jgi:hypothetical protein
MPEEQLEMATSMIKKFTSPTMMMSMLFASSLFFGLIISLITGLIMKKEQNEY